MEKPYFHELNDEERNAVYGTVASKVVQDYRQPDWCTYPEALGGHLGCWSLVSGLVTSEEFCRGCELHKDHPENPKNKPQTRNESMTTNTNESVLIETPHVKLKRTPRGFDYLERRGKDSVAVFLARFAENGEEEVLIRYQPLCVDNTEVDGQQTLFPCPITGGMEADETPLECALREVEEEAGYKLDNLISLTSYIVGTQTNEVCHLFWGDVTDIEPIEAAQDGSYFESVSRNEWKPFEFLLECEYVACKLALFLINDLE
jgi:hypothetical protein